MQELLKNMLYAGVGLASVTSKKAREVVGKLIEEGKSSHDNNHKVVAL